MMSTRTIFVADMHLRPGKQPEQNAALREFLARALALGAHRLIMLGDTFNFWFERGGRAVGDYGEVFAAFRELAAKGVALDLVSGNRDFMFGSSVRDSGFYSGFFRGRENAQSCIVTAAGINPRGFNCRFRQDGELIHCTHGDMYSLHHPGHGMMRWWTMALGPRIFFAWIPFFILSHLFGPLQRRTTLPYRNLLPTTPLLEPEVFAPMAAEGVRHIFCGHFHTAYRALPVPGGTQPATLHILPCWLHAGSFALFTDGQVTLQTQGNK